MLGSVISGLNPHRFLERDDEFLWRNLETRSSGRVHDRLAGLVFLVVTRLAGSVIKNCLLATRSNWALDVWASGNDYGASGRLVLRSGGLGGQGQGQGRA